MSLLQKKEFEARLARTEALLGQLENLRDEDAKRSAVEAIQALLALHGDGIARLLALVEEQAGRPLVEQLGRDEMVAGLLILHGLNPLSMETRVREALDKVRPYLGSHGGDVELLGIERGVVGLRLQGSCDGCPSSAQTLKYAIEQGIREAAPDVAGIEVADAQPAKPANFVPLSTIRSSAGPAHLPNPAPVDWQPVEGLPELDPAAVQVVPVAGHDLLFCRPEGSWLAYRDRCPACERSLAGARLEGTALACPACGRRFDARRAGRALDGGDGHLEPVPLLTRGGRVQVAVPAVLSTSAGS